jgi:hypothetical protein
VPILYSVHPEAKKILPLLYHKIKERKYKPGVLGQNSGCGEDEDTLDAVFLQ